ncbi:P-loop containing nucleoside triphosphate hydrolase protein [Absidia repens]|uniref:p-loop containing nucleoside triphosphate hydrolase protein n=1 Tax=Absidia repens TaxID=90262 RepID=A0A1X2HX31_9FUNG|nr:P-loop containing nucleoside triphosphate hydrolase protein [Absidia repens]
MPLEIIGAGFGRTGTMSLHIALEKLGYPTHHMVKLMQDETQDPEVWARAYDNPDNHEDEWEKVYGKYTAAVDWPTCTFYKELSERYPDAKVILTVRTPESWYKSMHNTIFKQASKGVDDSPTHVANVFNMTKHIFLNGVLENDPEKIHDQEYLCGVFRDHIAEVKRTIPADRLLVFELGSGWEPLCKFLNKDIPDEPYPVTNNSEEFGKLTHNMRNPK